MESPIQFDLSQLYANHMQTVKKRLIFAEAILTKNPDFSTLSIPNSQAFEFEFVCLQLRKILETIVQCSMISSGNAYKAVHGDFLKHARATNIIKNLNKLHNRWFPEFVYIHRDEAGGHYISPGGSAFNQKRWSDLYNVTSEILHVQNGFLPNPKIFTEFTVPDYFQKLKRHLSTHVSAQLDGRIILCELGDIDNEINVSECILLESKNDYWSIKKRE